MQLFELVSPRLFRPLAGPNRAFYAELLLLLWEECRHTADYSISRAEAVWRAEDYFAALAKPLALDADGAGDEEEQPTRDPHTLALGFLLRLRRTGWLEEQPGSYETEPTLAFVPEVTPLLDALEEILNPRVVTYTGKLYKAWQLLQGVGQEKSPYENVLREVASDLEALNKSLRALNASIGHYIDRLTHNRTPQEVLELFDQYEEKVVAAAYHRFKTSDNLFNYRAYLEEGLDDCEANYLPQLALDYARVERCAPGEAAPRVRALIQQQRDALEEMSNLIKEIDASHIRYRKRAVQRAQFLLLSDRSAQGSVTALLRRYAEEIRSPEQLFEPDDGPVAKHLHLYPAAVFGAKPLYPPAAPRTAAPLAPVRTEALDADQLQKEQQLLPQFDPEVSKLIQKELEAQGVQFNLGEQVRSFPGRTFVEQVQTNRGTYPCDLCVVAIGVTPNTGILAGTGAQLAPNGAVLIGADLATSVPGIYAVGDCAACRDGSLRTSSLKVADLEIARTGLTETEARKAGLRVKSAMATGTDRPGICPNPHRITIKLVYEANTRQVLGAQAWGEKNVSARINAIAVAIRAGMTVEALGQVDFVYSSSSCSIWDPVQIVCGQAQ